jgi:hypothetical protein
MSKQYAVFLFNNEKCKCMKRREFGKSIAAIGLGVTLTRGAAASGDGIQKKFKVTIGDPDNVYPRGKEMLFNSNPVFVITRGNETEIVKLNAELEMLSRAARKNADGFRFIELDLNKWEGTGYSTLLGKNIHFKMGKVYKSQLTSLVLNQDFPARLDFVIDYDLSSDDGNIESGLMAKGTAVVSSMNESLSNIVLDIESTLPAQIGDSDLEVVFCAA